MKTLEVFDRPMCCATGVCGPQVDPVLPRFAADLQWLASLGVRVERYSLSQQPGAFANNAVVRGYGLPAVDCRRRWDCKSRQVSLARSVGAVDGGRGRTSIAFAVGVADCRVDVLRRTILLLNRKTCC